MMILQNEFKDFLRKTAEPSANGRYYFFAANTNLNYLIEFNAEYGNDDYPVRIYLYRNNLRNEEQTMHKDILL